jgi:hypothetical protein
LHWVLPLAKAIYVAETAISDGFCYRKKWYHLNPRHEGIPTVFSSLKNLQIKLEKHGQLIM